MWIYVVKNSKTIALLYLGLYVLLSLLRPLSAVLWGRYVDTLSGGAFHESLLGVILLLIGYYLINIATDILCRCLEGQEDIEQLNIVQENRFQERILSNVYRKLNRIQYEYWEIPQMNDIVNRNMQFMNDSWNGISRGVMRFWRKPYPLSPLPRLCISIARGCASFCWCYLCLYFLPFSSMKKFGTNLFKITQSFSVRQTTIRTSCSAPGQKRLRRWGCMIFFMTNGRDRSNSTPKTKRNSTATGRFSIAVTL